MDCNDNIFFIRRYGAISGKVVIYPDIKEICISIVIDCGAWGGGYTGGRDANLTLGEFSEEYSQIPWTKFAYRIKGYTIRLHNVSIQDNHDKNCANWFKELGCIIIE